MIDIEKIKQDGIQKEVTALITLKLQEIINTCHNPGANVPMLENTLEVIARYVGEIHELLAYMKLR